MSPGIFGIWLNLVPNLQLTLSVNSENVRGMDAVVAGYLYTSITT